MFPFLVLVLIVVGPHVAADQYHKGNITVADDECRPAIVASATGSLHRRYVDLDGSCAYSEALPPTQL